MSKERDDLIAKINETRSKSGLDPIDPDKQYVSGNNGFYVGQSFTLTGKIEPAREMVDRNTGAITGTFIAAETTNGEWLSIKNLMGITSFKGYTLKGEATDAKGNKYVANLLIGENDNPDTSINFIKCAASRDIYEVTLEWMNNNTLKNKVVTYKGDVFKVVKSKKVSTDFNGTWGIGDARVISQKIFAL
jgi:hypothetical protein